MARQLIQHVHQSLVQPLVMQVNRLQLLLNPSGDHGITPLKQTSLLTSPSLLNFAPTANLHQRCVEQRGLLPRAHDPVYSISKLALV
ncbi:MAG TPA: hypothetical protein VFB99_06345, partial [Vicinamibacterales bacterium]|nr:hypothetical protein [Vicinamibacterales bacterium]